MVSRMEAYRIKRKDNLSVPDFWNNRFQDIDNRINAREQDAQNFAEIVNTLESIALARLNDTFTPLIVEAQQRLNNLGASFSAESLDTKTVEVGETDFVLTEASAESYVFTDYVQIRAATAPSNAMLARVVTFDRPNRLLSVDVVHTEGSGEFSDWLVRVGAPIDITHADRTDNPHEVTAAQVGAYTIAEANAFIDAAIDDAITALPEVDLSTRLQKSLNLSDLPDKAIARTNLGLKLMATQDTVGWGQLASNIVGNYINFIAKTPNKLLTAEAAWDAAYPIILTNLSGPVFLDFSLGINWFLQLAGPITLGAPVNAKPGQSGGILIYQGPGAGRTVSYAAGWYPVNGIYPALSTVATAYNYLTYQNMFGLTVLSGGKLTG